MSEKFFYMHHRTTPDLQDFTESLVKILRKEIYLDRSKHIISKKATRYDMKILAIETSCDETSIALIEATGGLRKPRFKILENIVSMVRTFIKCNLFQIFGTTWREKSLRGIGYSRVWNLNRIRLDYVYPGIHPATSPQSPSSPLTRQ